MSGRLKLRRGVVVSEEPLAVEVDGERRPAWADTALLGEMREGDEVVVNVEALDLVSARAASTWSTSTSPAAWRAAALRATST